MRLSAIVCNAILIFICLCGGVYAFSGFNLLAFLCLGNITAVRTVLACGFVAALFDIYALIAFRPYRGIK
ncbi:MAG: hypothetical protein LUI60_00410 [Clostridia bacterium]|nr:hypothetical protein [Clostridia bacterium]